MKQIRNIFHTIAGFVIAYPIAKYTGLFSENTWMSQTEKLIVGLVALTLLASFFGGLYEVVMKIMDNERTPNSGDVIRTGTGGTIACFATLFPFCKPLWVVLVILCGIGLLYDFFILIRKTRIFRKFIVKHFVLDYKFSLFKTVFTAPRASRIIFPLVVVTGFLHINPSLLSWIFVGLTAISLYLGFLHFRLFPAKRYELDEEQKIQYDIFKSKKN